MENGELIVMAGDWQEDIPNTLQTVQIVGDVSYQLTFDSLGLSFR